MTVLPARDFGRRSRKGDGCQCGLPFCSVSQCASPKITSPPLPRMTSPRTRPHLGCVRHTSKMHTHTLSRLGYVRDTKTHRAHASITCATALALCCFTTPQATASSRECTPWGILQAHPRTNGKGTWMNAPHKSEQLSMHYAAWHVAHDRC